MPVKVTKVACQQCGADLEVDESVRFVTCRYCSSRLEIVHDPTVAYSKVLEEVVQRQDSMEREVRILKLERELRRLEERWESYRQASCSRLKDGRLVEPSVLSGYVAFLIGGVAMIIVTRYFFEVSAIGGGLAGLVVGVIAYFIGRGLIQSANRFQRARYNYLQERSRISGEMYGIERQGIMPRMKRSGKPS